MDPQRRRRTEEPPLDERAQDHVRDDLEDLPDEDLTLDRRDDDEDDDDDDESLGRPVPLGR